MADRVRIWAPHARAVRIGLGRRRIPMQAEEPGWFEAADPLPPGADYRIYVDGGAGLPDPRSAWQPQGPLGPSRVLDHDAFVWHDAGWPGLAPEDVILYEVHVGTFSPRGTFEGVQQRIEHLHRLGVTAVELMPVVEFSGVRGWGYDGVDLYAPHHAYGGPSGLKALIDALHARGIAVIVDVVYNHVGPVGNFLDRFGPYFTDRYRTPWGRAMNLDGPDSDGVRDFLIDNAVMWLRDYHADGLRLDAVHAIVDTSAVSLLEALAARVRELEERLERRLLVFAESDRNDPRPIRPTTEGGEGLDALWSDDFHHALHVALTGERRGYYADFDGLRDVARALTSAYVYAGQYSGFRRRRHGRPATGLDGTRFIGYLQNHDQVGNRALGERIGALTTSGRVKIGAALVLLSPFTPLLFMGEEWGASTPFPFFSDHRDPRVASATVRGRLREFAAFGWDPAAIPNPQAKGTFASARLRWDEVAHPSHDEFLDWYRRLIALRKVTPALRDGRLDQVEAEVDPSGVELMMRRGPVTLACNLGPAHRRVPAPGRAPVLASRGVRIDRAELILPPDGIAIFA